MRNLSLFLAIALLAGCATTPTAPSLLPATDEDFTRVAAVREEAETLLRSQAEIFWRTWVEGVPADLASTYRGHESLFSAETIAQVERVRRETRDLEAQRALGFLSAYLASEHVAMAVSAIADEAANLEATATVTIDGDERAYRDVEAMLANEADHAKRARIQRASLPVVRKLNELLLRKQEQTEEAVRALGYESYAALGAVLRQADLDELATLADRFLTETEEDYRRLFGAAVKAELGLPLSAMRRADVPRLFKGASFDARFPREKALASLTKTLHGLGIELAKQQNITLHAEPLPHKNPRAVCFPVEVPNDIRLSIKPVGGVSDWAALFHEAGHAEHFAHVETDVFEFQQLGSNAVTESYAFLFEGLTEDREWLSSYTGLSGAELTAYLSSASAKKLYMVRRYAAKLLFELAWHRGALGEKTPQEAYRAAMERAYLFPLSALDAERYLVDHDDFFYSADYFRAWFLGAMLESKLIAKHGRRWWEQKAAGETLRALWRTGSRESAAELAARIGGGPLDVRPLGRRLAGRAEGGSGSRSPQPAATGARP